MLREHNSGAELSRFIADDILAYETSDSANSRKPGHNIAFTRRDSTAMVPERSAGKMAGSRATIVGSERQSVPVSTGRRRLSRRFCYQFSATASGLPESGEA
jgi:hypothetical protein